MNSMNETAGKSRKEERITEAGKEKKAEVEWAAIEDWMNDCWRQN